MWFQIDSPYFVAALRTRDEIVVEQAPIIGYMHRWHIDYVRSYCARKNWAIMEVPVECQ